MRPAPLAIAAALLTAAPAIAQTNPTFTYAKPDEAKPGTPPPPAVEWKAQVKGGFTSTTGNSQTVGGVLGGTASRKAGNNRVGVDFAAAYGRSNVLAPVIDNSTGTPLITALPRNDVETTNNWLTRGRYDRFFTVNNSGYASAQAAADKIAGKSFFGGAQIGYSRQLYKSDMHLVVAEIGYDFSYERYVQVPMRTHDPVTVHSARLFAGETLKLTEATGLTASVEALFNLNTEDKALNVSTGMPGVDPFKDTRVNGKLGLTTTLYKRLSIAFGFTLKYDQNPAPLPVPSGSPPGTAFSPTMFPTPPFADKIDTLTEATLIYTFL
jgi:hypothetical protein